MELAQYCVNAVLVEGRSVRAVAALAIVEHLEVLEESSCEFEARVPTLPVEQLHLNPAPERFHHGIVIAITDRPHRGEEVGIDHSCVKAQEVNWVP